MNNRLVISTECPSCGAPLDFSEGSNAIQCLHCHSNLLVTGRKQVLSYSVAPKLDVHRAVAKAMVAHKQSGTPCRVLKPQLYFIPYYRLTGQDFLWEIVPPEPNSETINSASSDPDLSLGLDLINFFLPTSNQKPSETDYTLPGNNGEKQFRDRYVEKNFVACDLQGIDMYSLGVRPSVLRLELFRREALEAIGKVVSVTKSQEAALSQGMKAADSQNILFRTVVGRVLSVIYFPFWVVEVERKGEGCLTILDAVSETIIKLDALTSLYAMLDFKATGDPLVIGFRPLVCPNCGWDFPVKPDDVIFFCSSCEKAWQIHGSCLYEVSYHIGEIPNRKKQGHMKYLPLWVLQAKIDKNSPIRFFVPAFRYRRLKFLSDLATHLSRQQPSYSVLYEKRPEVHGCYYDHEDAAMLAQFIHVGLAPKRLEVINLLQEERFSVTDSTLTWFPFKIQGNSLLDPFTGLSLPQHLLL
jgi:LSD1 subclass zinc finger protein